MNRFVLACRFLTIVPIGSIQSDVAPKHLAASMAWFPTVGLLIGTMLAATAWGTTALIPRGLSDGLILALLVVITGGLHQDGLADTIDGWVGGHTPVKRLAIMRDSCIGALGATALIVILGLRYVALSALPDSTRLAGLLCMPMMGRWAMVVGGWGVPYARAEGGLGQPFLAHLTPLHVIAATVVPMVLGGWVLGPAPILVAMLCLGLLARILSATASRLCGGMTGDVFGCINELAEVVFLIMLPILMRGM
jgi:adenosylcobinamide-GDP ribazoletransferase